MSTTPCAQDTLRRDAIPWGISRGLPTLCGVAVEEGCRECFALPGAHPRFTAMAGA